MMQKFFLVLGFFISHIFGAATQTPEEKRHQYLVTELTDLLPSQTSVFYDFFHHFPLEHYKSSEIKKLIIARKKWSCNLKIQIRIQELIILKLKEASGDILIPAIEHLATIYEDDFYEHARLFLKSYIHNFRMDTSLPRFNERLGKGIKIAVFDNGFYKIIPKDLWPHTKPDRLLLEHHGSGVFEGVWRCIHQRKLLFPDDKLTTYHNQWTTDYIFKNDQSEQPTHGSLMTYAIMDTAPRAIVWPVNGNFPDTKTTIQAFYDFAMIPDLHIINCSFELPCSSTNPYVIDPDLKEAMLYCLSQNKIIVLAASNTGKTIRHYGNKKNNEALASLMLEKYTGQSDDMLYEIMLANLFEGEPDDSLFFTNLIIAGLSRQNLLEPAITSVKPGHGPANRVFVYMDLYGYSGDSGGTSTAAAMISGVLANLWSTIDSPKAPHAAANVVKVLLDNAVFPEGGKKDVHGRGYVNVKNAMHEVKITPQKAL